MSSELFEYIESIQPSLGDEKRAKVGLLLMHYITLARVSSGRVDIDTVLTASGKSFAEKVLRNMSIVCSLAFALKIDMTCIFDSNPVPEHLKRLCNAYHIDVEACISRNKKLESARSDIYPPAVGRNLLRTPTSELQTRAEIVQVEDRKLDTWDAGAQTSSSQRSSCGGDGRYRQVNIVSSSSDSKHSTFDQLRLEAAGGRPLPPSSRKVVFFLVLHQNAYQ